MKTVGAYEAKTHLPRLLKRVARGEEIIITRHGTPVATLAPARDAKNAPPPTKSRPVRAPGPGDCAVELRWLAEHRQQYAGQWVALDGARLLSHGTNAREVLRAARRSKAKLSLVAHVEPPDALPFAGW